MICNAASGQKHTISGYITDQKSQETVIGAAVFDMGFKTMLTEGARQVLGWRNPDYVYSCAAQPKLNVLMRNYSLSNDIAVKIQNEMTYPGQVKITVIRETRAVSYAK